MEKYIAIAEIILAIAAMIIFFILRSYLKKHENEKMELHRNFIRKMTLALMLVSVTILSLGAIYLVIK